MSFAVDVNILVYSANEDDPLHEAAVRFVESCAEGDEVMYLAWPTLMSYIRVTTNPRILPSPLDPAQALANVSRLLGLAHVRALGEGTDFLEVYREVTGEFPVRGDLVPDAHLAAILKQNGIRTLYTTDADFRKFKFLDVRNPLR